MDRWTGAAASVLFASSLACINCVARGARIRTPNGFCRIEDLEVGDAILSVDPKTGEFVVGEITAIQTGERECLAVACEDGGVLACTSDHPVYDPKQGAYANAGDWVAGERSSLLAVTDDGVELREVTRSESFVGVREVYDLTVGTVHHNFVADGYLVHNKSPGTRECQVDGEIRNHGGHCTCPDGSKGEIRCGDAGSDAAESDNGRCVCEPDAGTDAGDVGRDSADSEGDGGGPMDAVDDTSDTSDGGFSPVDADGSGDAFTDGGESDSGADDTVPSDAAGDTDGAPDSDVN